MAVVPGPAMRGDGADPGVRVAVYGTLAPGRPNHHQLSALRGRWVLGSVRGVLVAEGWGADDGFPGIVLDDDAGIIQVFVFESTELPDHWDRLDDFEGPGYRRQATEVETDEPLQLSCCLC